MSFYSYLLTSALTFVFATAFLFYRKRKVDPDGDALASIYDFFWVLAYFGTLFSLSLTIGSQELKTLESKLAEQRTYEKYAYTDLLLKEPIANVCTEKVPLRSGETVASQDKDRENSCQWARDRVQKAQELANLRRSIITVCEKDDAGLVYGRTPNFDDMKSCGAANGSACARAKCDYDKAFNTLANDKFIKPMPTAFESPTFQDFRKKLLATEPNVHLNREVYDEHRPFNIDVGAFTKIWVWVLAVGFGLRLAKGWYDIHTKVGKALTNAASWFQLPPQLRRKPNVPPTTTPPAPKVPVVTVQKQPSKSSYPRSKSSRRK